MERKFKLKMCIDCGEDFAPNSGRQVRCELCRVEAIKKQRREAAARQRKRSSNAAVTHPKKKGGGRGAAPPRLRADPDDFSRSNKPEEEQAERRRSSLRKRAEAVPVERIMEIQERLVERLPAMVNIKDGEEPDEAA